MERKTNNLRQTQRIKPKTGKCAEILVKSRFIIEELPLPYVLYPNISGTFIGFASNQNDVIYFCSCTEPAIDNYIELIKQKPKGNYVDPLIMNPLSSHEFPPMVAEKSADHKFNPKSTLLFKDKICHKCNLATPTIRAMHPMYGGLFKQYYDWYIKQQYFHLGIGHYDSYLEDKCPDEIIELLKLGKQADEKASNERKRLMELVYGPKRDDIADDEITYWSNVTIEEAENFKKLEKESRTLQRKFENKIENIVRQEFGFRKVGEGWIGESILYKIVQRLFADQNLIRHHRPNWLGGLELDIYLPDIKLAFEYQGQQHYHPVKAWGGEKGLEHVKEKDKKKRQLCLENNVQLIVVDYTEPLTENHIKELIKNEK